MRYLSTLVVIMCGSVMIGCVAQADYDQLMVDNRAAHSERVAADQRALDAETQAEALRSQLRIREQELAMQQALASNLRDENQQLDDAFGSMQALLKNINTTPDRPLIIQSPLPPALDQALKNFVASHPGAAEYDPARGMIKLKSDLLFRSGSDVVRADAKSTLRSFAEVINTSEAMAFDVVVVGHTDNDPIVHARLKHPTNWHLSAHRAIAVGLELLDAQIDPHRVAVMGYGEFRSFVENTTKENKSLNRRVEIYLSANRSMNIDSAGNSAAAQELPEVKAPQK